MHRFLSRPKHTKRCASCVKNGTNASDVYCAHIAFFTGVRNVICKKIKTGSIFVRITPRISVSCVVLWVIYDTKCAHTAQKKSRRTPLDVIRPLRVWSNDNASIKVSQKRRKAVLTPFLVTHPFWATHKIQASTHIQRTIG